MCRRPPAVPSGIVPGSSGTAELQLGNHVATSCGQAQRKPASCNARTNPSWGSFTPTGRMPSWSSAVPGKQPLPGFRDEPHGRSCHHRAAETARMPRSAADPGAIHSDALPTLIYDDSSDAIEELGHVGANRVPDDETSCRKSYLRDAWQDPIQNLPNASRDMRASCTRSRNSSRSTRVETASRPSCHASSSFAPLPSRSNDPPA